VKSTSRDDHAAHAQPANVNFVRAGTTDAGAVTAFLLAQDVRPAPRVADIGALLGRSDAALFFAVCNGQIIGAAGCLSEDSVCRLIHFVVDAEYDAVLASPLIELVERVARERGASVLAAQAPRDSDGYRLLRTYGFSVDWEEGDVAGGRLVTMVDLVKVLG
jgi:hypothetical protein